MYVDVKMSTSDKVIQQGYMYTISSQFSIHFSVTGRVSARSQAVLVFI